MTKFNPKVGKRYKLATNLSTILAPNASAMTYRGTNTYLLGNRDVAVIDPGPPDEDHLNAILNALDAHQRISHVLVTHSHIDHSPLAMVLAQITGSRVHAFGPSSAGRSPIMDSFGDLGGGEGIDETFIPDVALSHGDILTGTDWSIEALHTPGHMGNHMCFSWREGRALFSGDLVMGWATSMVSPPDGSLTDFMSSLEMLNEREDEDVFYPGHGAPVVTPKERVTALLDHRRKRESQILARLNHGPALPKDIAAAIYDDLDPALLPAAERNVLAHLIDLTQKSIVTPEGTLSSNTFFKLK
ncbi:MAG: MBL fold metallo-hydrolase [Litoreibacter sp.]